MLYKLIKCLKLNIRVGRLATADKWLTSLDFAAGYDRVAPFYNQAWLHYLSPTTIALIERLPEHIEGPIIDLGCGSGFTTQQLSNRYPNAEITAVDISPGMLHQAQSLLSSPSLARRGLGGGSIQFVQQDMLDYLKSMPDHHAGLIFAGWSIGYSNPQELFRLTELKLKQNGTIAFIVNYMDTLDPVFYAYRICMADFPQLVERAAWLHFPKDAAALKRMLAKSRFAIEIFDEGYKDIDIPESNTDKAGWLLQTGILAGFDIMLPLQEHPALMTRFQELIAHNDKPLRHHYAMVVARSTRK